MTQGSIKLISLTSNTARALSSLFWAIEDEGHIHVTFDENSLTVNIELPRLQLGFYVGQVGARIYSRQFRGMVLDSDQTIGTLIGLSNKLTLRNEPASHERLVLIPAPREFGRQSITYEKFSGSDPIRVSINRNEITRVYAYSLDETLGRLTNTGDI